MNGELERQWLTHLGFETQVHIKCFGLSEDVVVDGRRGRLYVEVEWSKGINPQHNVIKYGPFLESGSIHDMILIQFIMPDFNSYPTSIELAQYAGELLTRAYPHHFRYHLENMRGLAKGEDETPETYGKRLETEFKKRLNEYIKNHAQNWPSDQRSSFESQDKTQQ